ncbi:A/G-specific adenine glycosylase [Legionella busanensis]|uniref:Adenine DNA glycosylase n=1 Tax=Legionella busanensis TaxID=190655 RepID=A0A378JJ64_9GAMM|nr:A/G-specific adenine glycosylase [Legionella busanensis]STX51245.1 A/G-specific adenine glycosylase [Legionella busanensis]
MENNSIYQHFSEPLLQWFDQYGRKNLPWQHPRSAYQVWISEIMLQQTQVQTVIPYFERFMTSFPTINHLANATEDAVLAHWSGLGYYSRARNLHKTAKIIAEKYVGQFPNNLNQLLDLPGIGPSTAAAIASLAFNQATAILDGNVKRVLTRYFMIDGWPEQNDVKKKLWQLTNQCMPKQRCADYTQAIMDLGATCCTIRKPACIRCPVQTTCLAHLHQKEELYPVKKIKKPLPIRKQYFFLLYSANHKIYLEKRPPTGLWGGLWCLPTCDLEIEPFDYLSCYQVNETTIQPLLEFRHTFSHFHLDIIPLALKASSVSDTIAESTGKWFQVSQLKEIGLAKPINKIIHNFLDLKQKDIVW